MKRLTLALIALTFNATVSAGWVKVGEDVNYEAFIAPDNIRINGNFRKAWLIRNLKSKEQAGQSDRLQMEYDCKEERDRTLYWSVHSSRFAGSELLELDTEEKKWTPVPPYTIEWDILKLVCSKQSR